MSADRVERLPVLRSDDHYHGGARGVVSVLSGAGRSFAWISTKCQKIRRLGRGKHGTDVIVARVVDLLESLHKSTVQVRPGNRIVGQVEQEGAEVSPQPLR